MPSIILITKAKSTGSAWCVAHIWFLSGFRNRFVVGASWFWNYLTFARGARLITGDVAPDLPATLVPRPALRPLSS